MNREPLIVRAWDALGGVVLLPGFLGMAAGVTVGRWLAGWHRRPGGWRR